MLCRTAEEFQSLADDRQQELEALWQGLLTLPAGLSADLPIPDWQVLLDQEPFTLVRPVMPHPRPFPPEPVSSDPRYQPELSRMDKLFKRGQEKKQEEALAAFHLDYENWQHNRHHIEQQNTALQLRYEESLRLWELRQQEYQEQQRRLNGRVEAFWQAYLAAEASSQDESSVLGGMGFERLCRLEGVTPTFRIERLSRPALPASRGMDEDSQTP